MSSQTLKIQSKNKDKNYGINLRKNSSLNNIDINHEDEELNQINKHPTFKKQQSHFLSSSQPLIGQNFQNIAIQHPTLYRVQSANLTSSFKLKKILMKLAEMGFAPTFVKYIIKENNLSTDITTKEQENSLINQLFDICARKQEIIQQLGILNENLSNGRKHTEQQVILQQESSQFIQSRSHNSIQSKKDIKSYESRTIKEEIEMEKNESQGWIDFSQEESSKQQEKKMEQKQVEDVKLQIRSAEQDIQKIEDVQCLICLEDISAQNFTLPQCKHTFCKQWIHL